MTASTIESLVVDESLSPAANQRRSYTKRSFGIARTMLLHAGIALFAFASAPTIASTIWNGPPLTFTKKDNTDPTIASNQDQLTANVWITRDVTMGLFNIVKEKFYNK